MIRTEWTARGLATDQHENYRTYPAQWVDTGHGELLLLQPCEEFFEGEWEGSIVELERRPVFSPN